MSDAHADQLTASQLARAWGVSRQNIHQLAKKGIIPRLSNGLFDEAEARRAYLRNSDPAFRRAPKLGPTVNQGVKAVRSGAVNAVKPSVAPASAGYMTAKSVRAHYQAKTARLRFEEKAGLLVSADQVKTRWFNTLRMVRDRIMQLPERLAPTLATETDPAVIRATLTAEITRILNDAEKINS